MSKPDEAGGISRREWTLAAGVALTAEIAEAMQHAHAAAGASVKPQTVHLEKGWKEEIEALTAEILPSGGGAGAREAGVVYFIDRALGGWEADKLTAYREGLAAIRSKAREMFPQAAGIGSLREEQVRELLRAVETTAFFDLLRTHTVLGYFGGRAHGGLRDGLGREWVGIEDRMMFSAPFGYYDDERGQG